MFGYEINTMLVYQSVSYHHLIVLETELERTEVGQQLRQCRNIHEIKKSWSDLEADC